MGGGCEEVAAVSEVELCQRLGGRRVEPEGSAASEQVLGRGERAQALPGHEHLRDVRGPDPLISPPRSSLRGR